MKRITEAFEKRFAELPMPSGLLQALDGATEDEKLCLQFLYAYMPVADIASYPVELFVKIVRHALEVRQRNLFNEEIPDEIFYNYILMGRINNENLEFNRDYFFAQIEPRVQGKTAEQACIEINYWCLEKLTYTGTDIRTLSPFTLLKTTTGRCGEESVFTVSALRAMGIPARQIYTPRWAHCESNHAWVEVYVGGKWRFLGACEPDVVLDKGWFTGPASKGMVLNSRTFSNVLPEGEPLVFATDTVCEINRTPDYAQHYLTLRVKVYNANPNVRVHAQIVSYCNFYTLATLVPDANGEAEMIIGKGDLWLHITDGNVCMNQRVDTRLTAHVEVDFAQAGPPAPMDGDDLIFAPPFSDYVDPDYGITAAQQAAHDDRTTQCHEIRNAYAATFANEEKGKELAKKYGIEAIEGSHEFFMKAKGNGEIVAFFDQYPALDAADKARLLGTLTDKDYADITAEICAEHLTYALPFANQYDGEIFDSYVLCPRIGMEMITHYRAYINDRFDETQKKCFADDPALVWAWIKENINETDEYKTSNDGSALLASPAGLLAYEHGGASSLRLLFVAVCRTLGIPARYNHRNGTLEYYKNGAFVPLADGSEALPGKTAQLTLKEASDTPLNYENFGVARYHNGEYRGFYPRTEDNTLQLPHGQYQLLTGRRLESGAMAVKLWRINLQGDSTLHISVPPEEKPAIIQKPIGDYDFGGGVTLGSLLGEKTLVACIRPTHEPTEHLLRELLANREAYANTGVKVVLAAIKDGPALTRVQEAYGADITVIPVADDSFGRYMSETCGLNGTLLPVLAMVNAEGNALYYIQGYHVGSVGLAVSYV